MTTIVVTLPVALPVPGPVKKKRVLLVDVSPSKRDLRAETLRKLGMEVDCAADITEARSWWRADLYNLVLVNTDNDLGHRDQFCEEVRAAVPPQQLAFLVGKPEYLAVTPTAGSVASVSVSGDRAGQNLIKAGGSDGIAGGLQQRWGILEASQKISAVRSLYAARFKAVGERIDPPRDVETRFARLITHQPGLLPELAKEELL